MKKFLWLWAAVVFGFVLTLSACGEKSQEDVVKKLDGKLEEMSGYKAKAEMKMNTGKDNQTFNIDIWHKKEDFYRVALQNAQDEKGSQIILKNKEGVFVLTPALKKSFEFQTNWPDNSSQPYLFQSLVNDIKKDEDASFKVTESYYVFETKTNYQSNNNLPFQEISFDKKTYTPVLVKVLDKDKNALVEVKFSDYEMNPKFKDDDFSMDANMSSAEAEVPVLGESQSDTLSILLPTFMAGSELSEKKEVELENGKRIVMTFAGEKNFTLIEEKMNVQPALSSPKEVKGEIVNLGHSIGALSENAIEWSNNGVDYYLASDELTKEELIEVAKSVQGQEVK